MKERTAMFMGLIMFIIVLAFFIGYGYYTFMGMEKGEEVLKILLTVNQTGVCP